MPSIDFVFNRAPHGGIDEDQEVIVSLNVTRGTPGRYHGPPERCYPGEPPEWDIEGVIGADTGEEVTLTKVELVLLDSQIEERIDDLLADYDDDNFDPPDLDDCRDYDFGNYDINGPY